MLDFPGLLCLNPYYRSCKQTPRTIYSVVRDRLSARMGRDKCEKCHSTKSDVFLHNSDQFMCKICAKYNDACLKHKVFPDWAGMKDGAYPTVPGNHVEVGPRNYSPAADHSGVIHGEISQPKDRTILAQPEYVFLPPQSEVSSSSNSNISSITAGASSDSNRGKVTDSEHKTMVINELLCFVSNKMDCLVHDILVKVCSDFYDKQTIEASKKILHDICVSIGVQNLPRLKGRKGPNKKSCDMGTSWLSFRNLALILQPLLPWISANSLLCLLTT